MFTQLAPSLQSDARAQRAAAWISQCVHCGFCSATCPSYRIWGSELDNPRGRIYQIRDMLQGEPVGVSMQQHLDRCLTCRGCESTCPSGVQYGALIEVGRQLLAEQRPRPLSTRLRLRLLRKTLLSPLLPLAVRLAHTLRRYLPFVWLLLPQTLARKLPAVPRQVPIWQGLQRNVWHSGKTAAAMPALKVILFQGCVQPSVLPQVDRATLRVLRACGVPVMVLKSACCGALDAHSDAGAEAHAAALNHMRRNIDQWWPLLQESDCKIVHNASACGLMVKEYAGQLAHDARYAEQARRVSAAACDLGELLSQLPPPPMQAGVKPRLAYHPPCTLQHGQKLHGQVEGWLRRCGFEVHLSRIDSHLCCGSAGAWSLLQPAAAGQLKQAKLQHLAELRAERIISANVGCIMHLASSSAVPVQHWIEVVAEHLAPQAFVEGF